MNVISRAVQRIAKGILAPILDGRGSWWPTIHEPYTGAWQRNVEWTTDTVLAFHAVYSCITLIASDIGKLRPKLVEQDANGIWSETRNAAHSPVLRKPNHYQNRIQFIEWWQYSKLIRGNTYALQQRDRAGIVRAQYLLDPNRVKPLVAPDGDVFYELAADKLSGLEESVTVPASEIIHDRINCIFHPLVGVSPIFASGLAANVGLRIENSSAGFFANGAAPSGVLTAPGTIQKPTADRLKEHWQTQFTGANAGNIAVLGDGLQFQPMRMTSVDAQLIEQLKWTAETVCSTFHVPPFKLGIGQMPTYQNAELLNQIYYSDCLQSLIEQWELCMDEGLGLTEPKEGKQLGVELDLDGLLRMDTKSQIEALAEGVGAGIIAPNEARQRLNYGPVTGGDSPMIQQQNYSLEALAKRDAQADPFAPATPPPAPTPPAEPDEEEGDEERSVAYWRKEAVTYQRAA